MTETNKPDVITKILSGKEDEPSPEITQLDCLIYRNDRDIPDGLIPDKGTAWEQTQGSVTVKVWEAKAKIRVRLSSDSHKALSMTRIAEIAMNAILQELNKEAE